VVVRLDLERDGEPVAKVDDAGVLARALEDAGTRGRQPPKQARRVLVAAVLRPEQREDGELEVVRVAAEQGPDLVELPVGQSEGPVQRLFGDRRQVPESSRPTGERPRMRRALKSAGESAKTRPTCNSSGEDACG
jgi:hypothetical protein